MSLSTAPPIVKRTFSPDLSVLESNFNHQRSKVLGGLNPLARINALNRLEFTGWRPGRILADAAQMSSPVYFSEVGICRYALAIHEDTVTRIDAFIVDRYVIADLELLEGTPMSFRNPNQSITFLDDVFLRLRRERTR